jgi:hypothetical protein
LFGLQEEQGVCHMPKFQKKIVNYLYFNENKAYKGMMEQIMREAAFSNLPDFVIALTKIVILLCPPPA